MRADGLEADLEANKNLFMDVLALQKWAVAKVKHWMDKSNEELEGQINACSDTFINSFFCSWHFDKKIISSTVYVELYITKNDHIAGCDIIFISYS